VFHENCDAPSEETLSDWKLIMIVIIIAVCGMIKSLIRHYQIRWLPEAAGCIIVGGKCVEQMRLCECGNSLLTSVTDVASFLFLQFCLVQSVPLFRTTTSALTGIGFCVSWSLRSVS
jgi:hypothetical protein